MTMNINKYKSMSKRRPCDACALRKIKCDFAVPCHHCSKHEMPCTNVRARKPPGPRALRKKTLKHIEDMNARNSVSEQPPRSIHPLTINLNLLIPFLSIYNKLFYSVWPIVSVHRLVAQIIGDDNSSPIPNILNDFTITPTVGSSARSESLGSHCSVSGDSTNGQESPLNTENVPNSDIPITNTNCKACCLAYSICAAIRCQILFVLKTPEDLVVPKEISAQSFANQARMIMSRFNFWQKPSIESTLSLFFLYAHYTNVDGQYNRGVIYLREAITQIQILQLAMKRKNFASIATAEMHEFCKAYYVLLVTERYACIEGGIPVLLESNLPLPDLENEENPKSIEDFRELVKIFAIPNKLFFDILLGNRNELSSFEYLYYPLPSYIKDLQDALSNVVVFDNTPDLQKLNIILSKYWMKLVAWRVAHESEMLDGNLDLRSVLSHYYPIKIAEEFLEAQKNIHVSAYELNGPGVCAKLYEITNALSMLIKEVLPAERHNHYELITSLLKLVNNFGVAFLLDFSKKFAAVVAYNDELVDQDKMENFFKSELMLNLNQLQYDIKLPPRSERDSEKNGYSNFKDTALQSSRLSEEQIIESRHFTASASQPTSYQFNLIGSSSNLNQLNDFDIELLQDANNLLENDSIDFSKYFTFGINNNPNFGLYNAPFSQDKWPDMDNSDIGRFGNGNTNGNNNINVNANADVNSNCNDIGNRNSKENRNDPLDCFRHTDKPQHASFSLK